MGHVSGCWENLDRAGVFDSTQAGDVLDNIVRTLDRAWDEKERINRALVREIAKLSSTRGGRKEVWRGFAIPIPFTGWALFIGRERLEVGASPDDAIYSKRRGAVQAATDGPSTPARNHNEN